MSGVSIRMTPYIGTLKLARCRLVGKAVVVCVGISLQLAGYRAAGRYLYLTHTPLIPFPPLAGYRLVRN